MTFLYYAHSRHVVGHNFPCTPILNKTCSWVFKALPHKICLKNQVIMLRSCFTRATSTFRIFAALAILLACSALSALGQDPTNLGRIDLRISRSSLTENAGTVSLEVTATVVGTAPTSDVDIGVTVTDLGPEAEEFVQYTGFTGFTITIPSGMRVGTTTQDIVVTEDVFVNKTNVLTLAGQVSTPGFTGTVSPTTLSIHNDDVLPVLQSVSVDGPVLTMVYDKAMSPTVNVHHFQVTVASSFVLVASAALNADDDKKVELTLTKPAKAGNAVTISYNSETTTNGSAPVTLKDEGGNEAKSFSTRSVPNKTAIPSVKITGPDGPVKEGAFGVTITFSEAMTGFAEADITVQNGTVVANSLATSDDTEFTVDIEPNAFANRSMSVSVSVAAGVATSTRSGTANSASSTFTVTSDQGLPVVTLSAPSGTIRGSFTLTMTTNEAVVGAADGTALTESVFRVTGGAASNFMAVGTTRNRFQSTITPTASATEIIITVFAGDVFDLAGNNATQDTELRRDVSFTPLSVTISTNAGTTSQTRPFKGSVFQARFAFSAIVGTGGCEFDVNSVDVSGGSVIGVTGSGRNYTANIQSTNSGSIGDANQVTFNLASNSVCDPADNSFPPYRD